VLYEKALKGTYLPSERSWIDLKEAADESGEEGQEDESEVAGCS